MHPFYGLCGIAPEHERDRHQERIAIPWVRGSELTRSGAVVLPYVSRWRRRQYNFGTCGGQATSAAIEVVAPELPRVSGVSLYRDVGRRLGYSQGNIEHGTRWSDIWTSLDKRGIEDWHDGEDRSLEEAGGKWPAWDNLHDELQAYDRRGMFDRKRLSSLDDIDDAIARGAGIVASFGVRDPFFDLGCDEVANTSHLGGNSNGHAMRVAGVILSDPRVYILDNWWDTDNNPWGGSNINGQFLRGHCRVHEDAMRGRWDSWAMTRAR